MEYVVVEAGTTAELQHKVNERIAAGWVPSGGVGVCYCGNGSWYFAQALVLLPPDDPDGE